MDQNNGLREILELALLLFLYIVCGCGMLWLATGQYPDLVYRGYIKNIEILISLIEAVEDEFDIRFTMLEVNGMKNVGEMATIIQERLK